MTIPERFQSQTKLSYFFSEDICFEIKCSEEEKSMEFTMETMNQLHLFMLSWCLGFPKLKLLVMINLPTQANAIHWNFNGEQGSNIMMRANKLSFDCFQFKQFEDGVSEKQFGEMEIGVGSNLNLNSNQSMNVLCFAKKKPIVDGFVLRSILEQILYNVKWSDFGFSLKFPINLNEGFQFVEIEENLASQSSLKNMTLICSFTNQIPIFKKDDPEKEVWNRNLIKNITTVLKLIQKKNPTKFFSLTMKQKQEEKLAKAEEIAKSLENSIVSIINKSTNQEFKKNVKTELKVENMIEFAEKFKELCIKALTTPQNKKPKMLTENETQDQEDEDEIESEESDFFEMEFQNQTTSQSQSQNKIQTSKKRTSSQELLGHSIKKRKINKTNNKQNKIKK